MSSETFMIDRLMTDAAQRGIAPRAGQNLKVVDSPPFGLRVSFPMPADCDLVIVGVQKSQFEPKLVCLPHQLYVGKLLTLLGEHDAAEILVMPGRSQDYVRIDKAFLQRETS